MGGYVCRQLDGWKRDANNIMLRLKHNPVEVF
jgi:hypothetical protein